VRILPRTLTRWPAEDWRQMSDQYETVEIDTYTLEDAAYRAAMDDLARLMPNDAEWDILAREFPPPQSWHDEQWEFPPMATFLATVKSDFAAVEAALIANSPWEIKVGVAIFGVLGAVLRAVFAGVVAVAKSLYSSATGK
jgi:hypothetical protein